MADEPSRPSESPRFDRILVKAATWTAFAFCGLLLAGWVATSNADLLVRSLAPAAVAVTGVWMLSRGRPHALVHVVIGVVALVVTVQVSADASTFAATFGLLALSIAAVLLARRGVVILVAVNTALVYVLSYAWNIGGWTGGKRIVEAGTPALGFAFVAILVVWSRREQERHQTSRLSAESALADSENRFTAVFESAAVGAAIVSIADGRFVRVNQAGCSMLGLPERALQRMSIIDITHPEDREAAGERFAAVVSGARESSVAELRYLRGDGTVGHALVSTSLLSRASGEPLGLVAHVVETSERVAARQALHEAVAARDRLIASVSHELRTPLAAIVGNAQLLQRGDGLTPDERDEMLIDVAHQADELTAIVEDLLAAARSDAGDLAITVEPVALDAEAGRVVSQLGGEHRGRIGLVTGSARGAGDPFRVRQITRNLITNAVRHGGTKVRVTVGAEDGLAWLAVEDDGPPITAAERERMFEPFQHSSTDERAPDSVGLGLTISRRLARLMGGDIVYGHDGEWSRFTLTLPAMAEDSTGPAEAA